MRTSIETFTDPGKELIGGEWETADGIDFIDEDYDAAFTNRQDRIGEHAHEAMHGAELRETPPAVFDFVFEMELLACAFDESVVPLLGCEILTETGEVEHGHARAVFAQAGSGADHERGFTHLAGGEDVADFTVWRRGERVWSAARSM